MRLAVDGDGGLAGQGDVGVMLDPACAVALEVELGADVAEGFALLDRRLPGLFRAGHHWCSARALW